MSIWTSITGVVTVMPMGSTQPEKRYILETVLEHLPRVTGSERNMDTYVVQKCGGSYTSRSQNEFGEFSNLGNYRSYGFYPTFDVQDEYIIIVDAALRDRDLKETTREFMNWLCRLAKRVEVVDTLVKIQCYDKSLVVRDKNDALGGLFELPSWCEKTGGEPTWAEYLLPDKAKGSEYPMLLMYKYFNDSENDREVERRREFYKSR